MDAIRQIIEFREALLTCFPKRKDAIMNLLDALTCHGHQYNRIVELSQSLFFKRQYSSITDAISNGLSKANWDEILQLVYRSTAIATDNSPNIFIMDCTSNPRPYAKSLADRAIVHYPNPAPGNKPICIGHQYSLISMLPNEILENQKHWLIPLLAQRVQSSQKGNVVGMNQMAECIEKLARQDELNISIGDSLYGTEPCRAAVSRQENWVHIFRINSKRNVFHIPEESSGPKGRKKEFGKKMQLNNVSTHPPCDREIKFTQVNKRGKNQTVTIRCWDNMLLRGSRKFQAAKHPLNVMQVCVTNEVGELIFTRPLWIGVVGKRRHEISLIDAYKHYRSRYDTEHLFRFQKNKLLMDAYQTPEVANEEAWWQLCLLAYVQLYLAKGVVSCVPKPWERYLPEYKNLEKQSVLSPTQTQRGFAKLLEVIGTPARDCVARGKPCGRMPGEVQPARPLNPVIFKSKKTDKKGQENILTAFEKSISESNPQKIDDIMKLVQIELEKLDISPATFAEMLINSS